MFGDYTYTHLLPYFQSHMTNITTRVDAAWDTYTEVRQADHESRPRLHCLRDRENEDEFFKFISHELKIHTADSRCHLLTTKIDIVLRNKSADLTSLAPCQQEAADTRMMLILIHAAKHSYHRIFLQTADSDVVVLVIKFFHHLYF